MRVALVTVHTSPLEQPATGDAGGLNVLVYALAKHLAKLGHEVTLVAPRLTEAKRSLPLPAGVALVEVDAPPGLLATPAQNAREELFVRTLTALLPRIDIVHSHYWLSAESVRLALNNLPEETSKRIAHTSSLHTLGAEKLRHGKQFADVVRIAAESEIIATMPIIALSAAEAHAIENNLPSKTPHITVILPGVDREIFSPPERLPASRALRLLCVGRIQPFKGQDFALEVFNRFQLGLSDSTQRAQTELVFAGSATPDSVVWLKKLRQTALDMGVGPQVTFLGATSRAHTAKLFGSSFVTIIPSRSETFGLVALESAACGTPVIAQRVGGLVESVSDQVSGMLMNNRDPDAWAKTLLELAQDLERYRALRRTAQDFASTHSWDETARKHVERYEQLKSSSR